MIAQKNSPSSLNSDSQKFHELIEEIQADLHITKETHLSGAHTSTGTFLTDILKDPTKAMLNSYNATGDALSFAAHTGVIAFLNVFENLIYSAYRQPNSLKYFIIFNNDNSDIRNSFFKYLQTMEEMEIYKSFPVSFVFTPKGVQHLLPSDLEKLNIHEGRASIAGK